MFTVTRFEAAVRQWYDLLTSPKTRDQLNRILAERTGQTVEKIERDTERDYFMFADEAKEYGVVDQVISKRP